RYPHFVVPAHRLSEIRNFVSAGLQDFSVSRLREKMPWGIDVPEDPSHVMYVWFDALVNYISTLGWPEDTKRFSDFWGTADEPRAVQMAGKDNLRQQSAMWQAMLLSAGLPTSRRIFIHGFITSGGAKMSKSTGNVVDPFDLVRRYGTDATRYYLLREIPAYEDGDFSEAKFRERYNADLANGLGNFTARVTTLAAGTEPLPTTLATDPSVAVKIEAVSRAIAGRLDEYRFHEALAALWELIAFGDAQVNETKPWAMSSGPAKTKVLLDLIAILEGVASLLVPFLPGASAKIAGALSRENGVLRVRKIEPLFPRLS
ncbi:MAG: class I tRNA ligase family protein, partial [Patescibacteria group bacterium]